MDFEVGQMVKIVRQSKTVNRDVPMEGMVGVIEEFQEYEGEPLIYFQEVKLDTHCGGSGSVPISCVEPCIDSRYVEARARWEQKREEDMARLMAESERLKKIAEEATKTTAEKCGLTPEQVQAVLTTYQETRRKLGDYV